MARPIIDESGNRYGQWSVVRQDQSRGSRAYWICKCDCGTELSIPGGALRAGDTTRCKRCALAARGGELHPNWRGDEIRYHSAHHRVRSVRGGARDHECIDCVVTADEWSLSHEATTVLWGDNYRGSVVAYSPNPDDYDPRCTPCHRAYDALQSRERPAAL